MKTFQNNCAQGDVFFSRRDKMPEGLTEQPAQNGRLVITHSETGHDHVMVIDRPEAPAAQMFNGSDPLTAWLLVNRPTSLDHLRSHDTHESILFDVGIYEIRRQEEYDPYAEMARRVAD